MQAILASEITKGDTVKVMGKTRVIKGFSEHHRNGWWVIDFTDGVSMSACELTRLDVCDES